MKLREGLGPVGNPYSVWPLSFEEAVAHLLAVDPATAPEELPAPPPGGGRVHRRRCAVLERVEVTADTEDSAQRFLEERRWLGDPMCPRCGHYKVYRMSGRTTKRRPWKCAGCRLPFSVRTGTVLEGSYVPLTIWVAVIRATISLDGVTAYQLSQVLGITNRTAWFMLERLRMAMAASEATFRSVL